MVIHQVLENKIILKKEKNINFIHHPQVHHQIVQVYNIELIHINKILEIIIFKIEI